MNIGIIMVSIRDGRNNEQVSRWVYDIARARDDAEFTLIDLKAHDVPLLTSPTVPGAANRDYADERVRRWSDAIDACDGFVFVTPEYNHGVPGAFKNAVDSLGPEWMGKTVAFVSYGADSGVRAVEQWRQILANFSMHDVRAAVALSLFAEFVDGTFSPAERRHSEVDAMLDQLVTATRRALADAAAQT